jgi:phosphatidylglycerophosphate synthase
MNQTIVAEILFYVLLGGLLVYAAFVSFITYRRQIGEGSTRATKLLIIAEMLFINGIGIALQVVVGSWFPLCAAPLLVISLVIAFLTWNHVEKATERWLYWSHYYTQVVQRVVGRIKPPSHKRGSG